MHFSRRVFRKAVLAHGPIQQPKNIHGMNPKAYVSIKRILIYYLILRVRLIINLGDFHSKKRLIKSNINFKY